jgi:hypothetical protein
MHLITNQDDAGSIPAGRSIVANRIKLMYAVTNSREERSMQLTFKHGIARMTKRVIWGVVS